MRIFGAVMLILSWLTAPIFYFLGRKKANIFLPPISNPILKLSITQLARKIRRRELTSEQVVKAYVDRCKEVNPLLNAVVEDRFEAALKEAKEVDQLIASRSKTQDELEKETPLLGVPITVKESIGIKGMSLSVGSKLRENIKAQIDGDSVRNLKSAGAIPIAVTNTPELCLCWETMNLITGCTNNPYNLSRTPGGSSGGEAALISSGASIAGVGSDLAGSIRIPSMFTGIFGHKPTPGYVSLNGHYPEAIGEDFEKFLTIGPMARYADDLKCMFKVMCGKAAAALRLDEEVDLKKLKVYYMENAGFSFVDVKVHSSVRDAIRKGVKHLGSVAGCSVKKVCINELEGTAESCASTFFNMKNIPDLMSMANPDNPKEKKNVYVELVKSIFGLSNISNAGILFTLLHNSNCFIPRSKKDYYLKENDDNLKVFQNLLQNDGVFIYPTHPIPAYYHGQFRVKTAGVMYTMVFNTLGMPSTHIPMGLNSEGLPVGFQVAAAPNNDRLCLAVAKELETAFKGWVPPPSK